MSPSPDRETARARPLRRAGFFLLLALLLGLPALVVNGLVGTDLDLRATVGSQPGGLLEGRLIYDGESVDDEAGVLGGQVVELYTVDLSGEREKVGETHADGAGEFSFEAPSIEGKYELLAGGGVWQRVMREASFLDRQGRPAPPRVLELPLRPGCALEVLFIGPPGAMPISGTYDLSGELKEGAILGILRARFHREAEFEDGRIEVSGLPPFEGKLQVFFGVGESFSLELTLEPGETTRRIEL